MKKPLIILVFILLLMVLRWGFLAQPAFAFFSSDDSVPLLMARHIAGGESLPVFYYGQHYQGALSSYLYALVMMLIGFSARNLAIINILLFAAGSVLLARALGPWQRTIWYFLLPLPALYFVSTETSRNFALVFLLTALITAVLARSADWKSWSCLSLTAFIAGLLFWVYQGSLVFSLPAGLLLMIEMVRRNPIKPVRIMIQLVAAAAAFLTGMLPLLIADLGNQFLTLKFTFSSSASMPAIADTAHWIWRFLTLGAYNQYVQKSASLQFAAPLTWLVALMTAAGYLLYTRRAWRSRKGLSMSALPLMVILMLSATRFGRLIAADDAWRSRYQVHSLILMPLALFFIAYGLYCLDRYLAGRVCGTRSIMCAGLVLVTLVLMPFSLNLNRYARDGGRRMVSLAQRLNQADVPELIFGPYTRVFRYNVLTREKRLMLPTPAPIFDNPAFAMVRYYPYALKATEIWESSPYGLLESPRQGRWLHARLREMLPQLRVRLLELPESVLLVFPARTPLRLLDRDVIQSARPWPSLPLPDVRQTHENEIRIHFSQADKPLRYDRVHLNGVDSSLSVPIVPRDPVYGLQARMPDMRGSETRLSFLGVQLAQSLPGPGTRHEAAAPRVPTGVTFSRYSDPVDMVYFHQQSREMRNSRGLILAAPLTVSIQNTGICGLEFHVTNPFAFESPLWPQKRKQAVRIDSPATQVPCDNGDRVFRIPVDGSMTFTLAPRYRCFFKTTDSGQATDVQPVGVLIRSIKAVYQNGGVRDVTPLVFNRFLEAHRLRVRARAGGVRSGIQSDGTVQR